jgi:hypothetical protein
VATNINQLRKSKYHGRRETHPYQRRKLGKEISVLYMVPEWS